MRSEFVITPSSRELCAACERWNPHRLKRPNRSCWHVAVRGTVGVVPGVEDHQADALGLATVEVRSDEILLVTRAARQPGPLTGGKWTSKCSVIAFSRVT